MKRLLMVAFAIAACAVMAEGTDEKPAAPAGRMVKIGDKLVPIEKVRESVRKASLKKTGGRVRRKGSADGWFVVVNAAGAKADGESIQRALNVIDRRAKVQTKWTTAESCGAGEAKGLIAKAGGRLGVVIVSEPGASALVVAPEDGWAVVNVDTLAAGGADEAAVKARMRKELLRAFAFVAGGAYGAKGDFMMRDVASPKDLDALKIEDFGVELMRKFEETVSRYGIRPWHEVTYLKACQEGWAPQPTNEFQQAIWNDVHQLPSKPIKIEFDSTKGK